MQCDKHQRISETIAALEEAIKRTEDEFKAAREPQNLSVSEKVTSALTQRLADTHEYMEDLVAYGEKSMKNIFSNIQKEIDEQPWKVLAKVAAGSFSLGLILRSIQQNKNEKETP